MTGSHVKKKIKSYLCKMRKGNKMPFLFLFFDEFSIRKISIKLQSEVRENNNLMMGHIYRIKPEDVYEVMTPSLKIQWINLGGSKCMLKRIITISDNKCIYHDTEKWHKTDLWYAF